MRNTTAEAGKKDLVVDRAVAHPSTHLGVVVDAGAFTPGALGALADGTPFFGAGLRGGAGSGLIRQAVVISSAL